MPNVDTPDNNMNNEQNINNQNSGENTGQINRGEDTPPDTAAENTAAENTAQPDTRPESPAESSDKTTEESPGGNQDTTPETGEAEKSDKPDEPAAEEPKAEAQPDEPKPEAMEETPKSETKPEENAEESKAEGDTAAEIKAEVKAEDSKDDSEDKKEEEPETKENFFDDVFDELKKIKEEDGTVEVHAQSRVRGGIRVYYKEMPMFLPASHFALKRNPPEDDLMACLGNDIRVKIHEMAEDETRRKTVIVTRKGLIEDEFWDKIEVGQVVEGTVSSIASFGIFLDLGGVEGLIHISRLSQAHIDDPRTYAKKGDKLKAKIVDIKRDRKRIALSRKELEESPWKNIEEEFPGGTRVKGIVRRITDFGAYIELKPGVDGLLRTSELSWTKRVKNPGDVLNAGDEVEVEVLNANEEKQTVALSLKALQPNPWDELGEKYPIGTETKGTVKQVLQQGLILNVDDVIDGFMPKSKMRGLLKDKKMPYKAGDEIEIVVTDMVPDKESFILSPKGAEEDDRPAQRAPRRQQSSGKVREAAAVQGTAASSSFTFGDLLSEAQKNSLLGNDED
jgi:small subunit ribosomal protein S1